MNNRAKLVGIAPQLVVNDVVKTAGYYRDVLGFTIIKYVDESPIYAMVERDGFQIHFGKSDSITINLNENFRKGTTDLVIWVPEIEKFFEEVKSHNANISQEIVKRSYGREFIIRDCDGHTILVCD